MFYVLCLYRIYLGIRVENEVRKVVRMILMIAMPKFIPWNFCMISNKKPDLDRGRSSIKGFIITSIELHTSIEGQKNTELSLLEENQCFYVSSRGVNPSIHGTQLREVHTDRFITESSIH